jgi:hypothetical protein
VPAVGFEPTIQVSLVTLCYPRWPLTAVTFSRLLSHSASFRIGTYNLRIRSHTVLPLCYPHGPLTAATFSHLLSPSNSCRIWTHNLRIMSCTVLPLLATYSCNFFSIFALPVPVVGFEPTIQVSLVTLCYPLWQLTSVFFAIFSLPVPPLGLEPTILGS